jgi:hypothetical protein
VPSPVCGDARFPERQGLLAWEDEGYVVEAVGGNGQFIPGKAAKWCAGSRLMRLIEEMEKMGEKGIVGGAGEHGTEQGNGEVKNTVYRVWDHVQAQDQDEEEERDILYGRNPDQSPILLPCLTQYRAQLELLERLGIDPPTRRPQFLGSIREHVRTAA